MPQVARSHPVTRSHVSQTNPGARHTLVGRTTIRSALIRSSAWACATSKTLIMPTVRPARSVPARGRHYGRTMTGVWARTRQCMSGGRRWTCFSRHCVSRTSPLQPGRPSRAWGYLLVTLSRCRSDGTGEPRNASWCRCCKTGFRATLATRCASAGAGGAARVSCTNWAETGAFSPLWLR